MHSTTSYKCKNKGGLKDILQEIRRIGGKIIITKTHKNQHLAIVNLFAHQISINNIITMIMSSSMSEIYNTDCKMIAPL